MRRPIPRTVPQRNQLSVVQEVLTLITPLQWWETTTWHGIRYRSSDGKRSFNKSNTVSTMKILSWALVCGNTMFINLSLSSSQNHHNSERFMNMVLPQTLLDCIPTMQSFKSYLQCCFYFLCQSSLYLQILDQFCNTIWKGYAEQTSYASRRQSCGHHGTDGG